MVTKTINLLPFLSYGDISEIAQITGFSRTTVYKYLTGGNSDAIRERINPDAIRNTAFNILKNRVEQEEKKVQQLKEAVEAFRMTEVIEFW